MYTDMRRSGYRRHSQGSGSPARYPRGAHANEYDLDAATCPHERVANAAVLRAVEVS